MKNNTYRPSVLASFALCLASLALPLPAQDRPEIINASVVAGELVLRFTSPASFNSRVEVSTDAVNWSPLYTFPPSAGLQQHTDTSTPYLPLRYYRVVRLGVADAITGDHITTDEGDVVVHPIDHASFVMIWNGKTIYNDPVGGAGPYQGLPRADLILVSHEHGDHFNASTLSALSKAETVIVTPQQVFNGLSATLRNQTEVLSNGDSLSVIGLTIDAVPAYNGNHPVGRGNGYVLTIGGKRFYMSGDTGDIPEMRALQDIDVAFVCMNVPFTMTVTQAASAVRDFRPRVIYPYHYRNQNGTLSDLNAFKQLVGRDSGVAVRQRGWY